MKHPGAGAKGAGNRVNRGGSWNNVASNARCANRNTNDPSIRNNNLGVRPASPLRSPNGGVGPQGRCRRSAGDGPPLPPLPRPRGAGKQIRVRREP